MTTAAQRQTAITEAYAAMVRAISELETARSLMIEHVPLVDSQSVQANNVLDDAITEAHDARRKIGRLWRDCEPNPRPR